MPQEFADLQKHFFIACLFNPILDRASVIWLAGQSRKTPYIFGLSATMAFFIQAGHL